MSTTSEHSRWRADLAAYLLGSLEPEEVEALERHLERCGTCRDELRWHLPAPRPKPIGGSRRHRFGTGSRPSSCDRPWH